MGNHMREKAIFITKQCFDDAWNNYDKDQVCQNIAIRISNDIDSFTINHVISY